MIGRKTGHLREDDRGGPPSKLSVSVGSGPSIITGAIGRYHCSHTCFPCAPVENRSQGHRLYSHSGAEDVEPATVSNVLFVLRRLQLERDASKVL